MIKLINILALLGTILLYNTVKVNGATADESVTGALLKFTYTPFAYLKTAEWVVAPSQFGIHNYGGSLEAWLILPGNTSYHTECTKEPSGYNEYIHYLKYNNPNDDKFIMLIDRGDCYFVTKVENAQALGASGVIVLDYFNENLFTMWPPEDWDDDINITSVLLDYNSSYTLMNALNVMNWNGFDSSTMSYPDPRYNFVWMKAKLEWGLPHPDDRVEWELWTSSNDDISINFKQNFKDTSIYLNSINDTIFTPHMYILNGSHWGCDIPPYLCGNQCTNKGKFCAVDPEYNLMLGVSGSDVVQENLRSLCVYKYSKDVLHNESIWWDYAVLWDQHCFNGSESSATFHINCSYIQMDHLDSNLKPYVNNCVISSGGYYNDSDNNTILYTEVNVRETRGIYTLPSIIVNEFTVHGSIDCDIITTATCQPLDAICAGFLNGTEPDICHAEYCDPAYVDCSGTCHGNKQYDSCGQCLNISDIKWNKCYGCDNVAWSNKTTDCKGVCGGHAVNVECNNNQSICIDEHDTNYNHACDYINGETSTSSSSSSSSSTTVIVIISIISLIVIIAACFVIYKLYKRQNQTEKRFNSLLKQYTLMDENPKHAGNIDNDININNDTTTNTNVKTKTKVPDHDDEDF